MYVFLNTQNLVEVFKAYCSKKYLDERYGMKNEVNFFGITNSGQEVKRYTLTNDFGYSVSILNYGGIICGINIPDKEGVVENIVLGHTTIKNYEENSPYFGCITGRTAGRINNAEFKIDETIYKLNKNNGNHNLHGGLKGFDKVIWSAKELIERDCIGLSLNYVSKHLEEGYPGNLDMTVIYKWNNENELTIRYLANTDMETPITLTNHTYFNLSGDLSTTILDHELHIAADQFVKISANLIPFDISNVEGTPFDFRLAKAVGQDIDLEDEQIKNGKGYDHPFVLNGSNKPQITLVHKDSGRKLSVLTNEKCLVCYTGNFLTTEMKAYDHISIQPRSGICLETQYYPDSLNFELVPSKTLKPSETYDQTTMYKFSVLKI